MPRKKKRIRRKVVVGHDPNGTPIVKWAIGYTEREVTARKQALVQEFSTGSQSARSDSPYRFYAQSWYDTYKKADLSASSRRSYANAFNNHIFPYIGDKQLRAISAFDLQSIMGRLRGKSSTLIGDVSSILKNTFAHAYAHGAIARNPAVSLSRPPSKDGTRRALTDAESKAALQVGMSHPCGLLPLLLYYTGARRWEALGLRWGDVDFEKKRSHVRRDIDFATNSVDSLKRLPPYAIFQFPIRCWMRFGPLVASRLAEHLRRAGAGRRLRGIRASEPESP